MKKILILLFSILISFNSYGEIQQEFHNNGQIKSEIELYENGEIKSVIQYDYYGQKTREMHLNKNGKLNGKVILWMDGYLMYDAIYKDGKCVSAKPTSRTVKNNNCNIYIDGGPYKVDKLIN